MAEFYTPNMTRDVTRGDKYLQIGDLDVTGEVPSVSNVIKIIGMTAMSAMENQAEASYTPADDVPDHDSSSGTALYEGSFTLLQEDENVATAFLGFVRQDGVLYQTENFPKKVMQHVRTITRRNKATNTVEKGYRIITYYNISVKTANEPESETNSSDGVDPINYEYSLVATGAEAIKVGGVAMVRGIMNVFGTEKDDYEAYVTGTTPRIPLKKSDFVTA
jgi:hypothetical protein